MSSIEWVPSKGPLVQDTDMRGRIISLLLVAAMLAGIFAIGPRLGGNAIPSASADEPLRGEVDAPEFPENLDWLNTGGQRLSLEALRGKVVLLDFWTYGCINCVHIIPHLKALEAKYHDSLVVIGVHSAKFEREGRTEAIQKLVLRYELEHPVVNDKDFKIWRSYRVNAWPTQVLIDPVGKVVGKVVGEGHHEALDAAIGKVIETFETEQKLDKTALSWPLERQFLVDRPLLFPGKVTADGEQQRLFISDSNHHRIVVTDLEGRTSQVIGAGTGGYQDGSCRQARFRLPQGTVLADPNTLYVADTENHAIRKVDLASCQVTTVAGNGRHQYIRQTDGVSPGTPLNSPWDLAHRDGQLYIAMAGQHQIWVMDLEKQVLRRFAGSGREALTDSQRHWAGFNQPSGLALDDEYLYVADAEASAIRQVGLGDNDEVKTLVGTGLFDFGDVDGVGNRVRLQHVLGVALWQPADGGAPELVLADTYNSKIKRLNPKRRKVTSISQTAGVLDEPGGISVIGDLAFIADTNNHRVQRLNLKTGQIQPLTITNLE